MINSDQIEGIVKQQKKSVRIYWIYIGIILFVGILVFILGQYIQNSMVQIGSGFIAAASGFLPFKEIMSYRGKVFALQNYYSFVHTIEIKQNKTEQDIADLNDYSKKIGDYFQSVLTKN